MKKVKKRQQDPKPVLELEVLAVCTNCGFKYYDGPQGQCDCDPKHVKYRDN